MILWSCFLLQTRIVSEAITNQQTLSGMMLRYYRHHHMRMYLQELSAESEPKDSE